MPVSLPSEEESRRRRQAGEEEGEVLFLFHRAELIILMFLIILSSSDPLNDCFQEQQGVLSLGQECEDWPVQRVSNSFLCKYFNAKNKVNILTHKSFSINICPSLKLSNLEQPTISKSMTFYFSAVHLGKEECEESQS